MRPRWLIVPLLFGLAFPAIADDADAPADSAARAAELLETVAPAVEELRGLAFLRDVPVQVIDDAAAREHLVRRLDAFEQREALLALEQVYARLGLLPLDFDIWDAALDVMDEQAGGYYDPETGAYFLLADLPPDLAPIVTAHELTHAVEDQHYDLDGQVLERLGNDDAALALAAVHEGSATLLMLAYAIRETLAGRMNDVDLGAAGSAVESERLDELPAVLSRQLVAPYVLGAAFLARGNVLTLAAGFPVDDVRRVYDDLPRSTEQILHPSKYWGPGKRDEPVRVDLRGAGQGLGRGFRREADGVLGELVLASLTGSGLPSLDIDPSAAAPGAGWTNDAATGWGGDRWELWTGSGRSALLLLTVWDSVRDAEEFADALPHGLEWKRRGDRVAVVAAEGSAPRPHRLLRRLLRQGSVTEGHP